MLTFYTIFVSHNEAHRYYYILFKVSRIIDLFPYKLESHYHVVLHGCSNCFVSVHYFDYHVSLNLANILHNFCVSQWSSWIVYHNFQSISHHGFISLQIGFSLTCGCPWKQYLFRQCPLFRLSCFPNLANILHKFCVSQWSSSILLHTFQGISHHWLIFLQNGVTLSCGCPWMQCLFRQCPLFSIIMFP